MTKSERRARAYDLYSTTKMTWAQVAAELDLGGGGQACADARIYASSAGKTWPLRGGGGRISTASLVEWSLDEAREALRSRGWRLGGDSEGYVAVRTDSMTVIQSLSLPHLMAKALSVTDVSP